MTVCLKATVAGCPDCRAGTIGSLCFAGPGGRKFSLPITLEKEQDYMRRALELARRAEGRTSPNPMVGALIVNRGRVVGTGFHEKAGSGHAEIAALKEAGSRARGADLILNLEPCCHFGRTPPCTEAIVAAGLRRVVIGMRDPNPAVRGKGIRLLRKRGIEVVTGVLREECERLNEAFSKFIRTRRPYVILKSALSLDGKIATACGESKWISGPPARAIVHQMRNRVDAIMVGAGTVLADDPRLTARLGKGKGRHPSRVILDNEGLVPLTARVFHNSDTQRVLYVGAPGLPAAREKTLRKKGVEVLLLKEKRGVVDLDLLMKKLGEREVVSILIEGGAEVNASALQAGIVDKVIFFLAPMILGGKNAPGAIAGQGVRRLQNAFKIKNWKIDRVGEDLMIEGYL